MSETKKYTLGEIAAYIGVVPMVFGAIAIATLPLGLATAWMRSTVWNWFGVPYLHLPTVGVLPMFAIECLLSLFRARSRELKGEFYAKPAWRELIVSFISDCLQFGFCVLVHLWLARG